MNSSVEASAFTETLVSVVRLQCHLAARVIISTQEPTISTTLLNLCSVTIVHRFTSPEWLRILKNHIAGACDSSFHLKGIITAYSDRQRDKSGKTGKPKTTRLLFSAGSCICELEKLYYFVRVLLLKPVLKTAM